DIFGAGSCVLREWDEAGGHHDLGTDGLIERLATSGEGGCDGRVGVDDSLHIRTGAVDSKMHADLAGDFAQAGELVAVQIDDDHVGGLQERLAAAGRGRQDAFAIETHGEIACCCGSVADAMHRLSDAGELLAEIRFEWSRYSARYSAGARAGDVYLDRLFGKGLGHRAMRLSLAVLKTSSRPCQYGLRP